MKYEFDLAFFRSVFRVDEAVENIFYHEINMRLYA